MQTLFLNLQHDLTLTLTSCMLISFSGVIFQTNKDGTLPPHVLYKIRQNSSFTEKTNEIRRAYWRPGPNTGGKFYFLYGFVWIQGKYLKYSALCLRLIVLVQSADSNSMCYKSREPDCGVKHVV